MSLISGIRQLKGSWTPAFTFATAGDVSVSYSAQEGEYYVLGDMCELTFRVIATPTFTTSVGNMQLTGSPFTAKAKTSWVWGGRLERFRGITKANYQNFVPSITNNTAILLVNASGSAQTEGPLTIANFTTAAVVVLYGSIRFPIA